MWLNLDFHTEFNKITSNLNGDTTASTWSADLSTTTGKNRNQLWKKGRSVYTLKPQRHKTHLSFSVNAKSILSLQNLPDRPVWGQLVSKVWAEPPTNDIENEMTVACSWDNVAFTWCVLQSGYSTMSLRDQFPPDMTEQLHNLFTDGSSHRQIISLNLPRLMTRKTDWCEECGLWTTFRPKLGKGRQSAVFRDELTQPLKTKPRLCKIFGIIRSFIFT